VGLSFDGTTDLVTIDPSTNTYLFGGGGTYTYSHPSPFVLANGSLLIGYTCDDFDGPPASLGYVYRCKVATLNSQGVITSIAPTGTGTLIAGTGASGVTCENGTFVQLSGGTIVCFYEFEESGILAAVQYKTSTDNGVTWSSATTIISGGNTSSPSAILIGSTLLVVCVGPTNNPTILSATVTSSTVGSFGSPVVISTVASGNMADPKMCNAGNSTLLVAFTDNTNDCIQLVNSTDLTGAAWGTARAYNLPESAAYTIAENPQLVLDGSIVWMFYDVGQAGTSSVGVLSPGDRTVVAATSADNGTTWSDPQCIYQGYAAGPIATANPAGGPNCDNHRAHGCLINGVPVVFADSFQFDSSYHICRLDMTAYCIAGMRAQGLAMASNNLSAFTFGCWFKYGGSVNSANNMMLIGRSLLYSSLGAQSIKLLELFGFTGASGSIRISSGYSTTSIDYRAAQTFTSGQWIFVAGTVNPAGTAGSLCTIYSGTTPANLSTLALTFNTDNTGTLIDDSGGNISIGGRNLDQARTTLGDIDGAFIASGALTLSQLQQVMAKTLPTGTDGFWLLPATAVSGNVLPDSTANDNQAQVYGTVGSSSPAQPPIWSVIVGRRTLYDRAGSRGAA
jgi:hypothetical protein